MLESLRVEDERLVTGRGRYVGNLVPPGALHCAFVRSADAHGLLTGVETGDAASLPGVVAVLTAGDLALADIPDSTGRGPGNEAMTRPPLARDRVRYAGEAVAVVVAQTAYQAADAAELVYAEVEPEPVVADADAALTGDTLLFPAAGSNVVAHTVMGDGGDGDWPLEVTVEVENQRVAPVPLEPLAILARPEEGGGLTVWCGHQAAHRLRGQLAGALGLAPERIRVIIPDVGGAFGMKGMLFPEYLVVAAAALRLGRPVTWLQTRSEQFTGGTHGRAQRHRVELAGERSGRIRQARVEILAEVGAYPHNGSQIPVFTRYLATGLYDIADLRVETTTVVTNRAPTGSYRGAGRPEAAYAIERAVEAFARAGGLDPAEVRRVNFIPADAMPHRTATGALYDGGDYARALDLALELADAPAVRAEQRRRRAEGGRPLGLGIGAFVERAGGAVDSSEYARVEVNGDGRVVVRVGTGPGGQGHETVWAGLAADALGVDLHAVTVLAGDTAEVAEGTGTFGSRSAQIAGSAILRTARAVRDRARELAADRLEVAPADLVLRDGLLAVRGDPAAAVPLADLATEADLSAEETYAPGAQTFPYGVYVAVVEVDPETGRVDLCRIAAVDDCGNVLHPQIVEGQLHGSIMQGVAQALYEGIDYSEDGQLRTSSLVDYLVPSAPEMPALVERRLVTPAPSNPLGAKGAGESGCIGAPPAIVNAVLDALAPLGVTDLSMPLTPEQVWRAIQEARNG